MATPLSETIRLPDALRDDSRHSLEFYRQSGAVFLKVELAPPSGSAQAYRKDGSPYTASITGLLGPLSLQQIQSIEQAVAEAKRDILA
jgi:hypothetical protein